MTMDRDKLAAVIALCQLGYRFQNQGKNGMCDFQPDGDECKEIAAMILLNLKEICDE